MHIVLRTGGMPFNGDTLRVASLGGSETAALYLARELAAQGHEVVHFTNSEEEGIFDGVRYSYAGPATEAAPMGERYHFYALNTPHDVNITQRHPAAFRFSWHSKLNYLWLHDLALHRQKGAMVAQMDNIDRVLVVSEYHKKQVCSVYGFAEDIVSVLPNGVDPVLYATPEVFPRHDKAKHLIYSSRPERGLENLVRPNGIMEQLGEGYHLHVCGYDNTTEQMHGYYSMLWQRCEELPNVTNHGALTKGQLATMQANCDAWIYPTEFEEVFCITAVEAAMAGCHIIASDCAVLPETCGAGVTLVPMLNGKVDDELFANRVKHLDINLQRTEHLEGYTVRAAGDRMLTIMEQDFIANTANHDALARHLLHMSDISALLELRKRHSLPDDVEAELQECYGFYLNNTFAEHYAAYYDYEKKRGVDYGPETLDGNSRFEFVADRVGSLPAGSTVLDYGCAHGHYTINLAKRNPQLNFVGIDIAASNVAKAKAWAGADNVQNVKFVHGCFEDGCIPEEAGRDFALIIAAEVAEHVADPAHLVYSLSGYLADDGQMLVTTPFGPWEAIGYKEHWPWRAHIHHLERADLRDLFGACPDFSITVAPSGNQLGSYITMFSKPDARLVAYPTINYERKLAVQSPRQTLSVCMIAKDAGASIRQTIDSVKGIATEIIVAVDETTKDDTRQILKAYAPEVNIKLLEIRSPLVTGFDAARNVSIEKATGDWILWIDADEVLHHSHRLLQYLRPSQYKGFAIKQHHVAVEPASIIKTDLPCRLFRNGRGVRFFGVVHEHPEVAMNDGLGEVTVAHDVDILHSGYATEAIRRKRFERNIGLMVRDREQYPERTLGKFLWLRDLSLMCRYAAEANGGKRTQQMVDWAEEGIAIWEELLADKNWRLVVDGLEYYSLCNQVMGDGFEFAFILDSSKANGGAKLETAQKVQGIFSTRSHAMAVLNGLAENKIAEYESRYF